MEGNATKVRATWRRAQQSGIPDRKLTLVDESDRLTHTDPMGVETAQNPLVETLVRFLREVG